MTYRIGHHSTSDDSSAYRSVDEVQSWNQKDHPITRLRRYMERKEWWNNEKEESWKIESKETVMKAFMNAEKQPKPNYLEMFNDVYDEMPDSLKSQVNDLEEHLKLYSDNYPMSSFKQKNR